MVSADQSGSRSLVAPARPPDEFKFLRTECKSSEQRSSVPVMFAEGDCNLQAVAPDGESGFDSGVVRLQITACDGFGHRRCRPMSRLPPFSAPTPLSDAGTGHCESHAARC